jgi:hypothetical protein
MERCHQPTPRFNAIRKLVGAFLRHGFDLAYDSVADALVDAAKHTNAEK